MPLNGDLHNQGLDDVTPQMVGSVTFNNNGKIGKAASFPNSCASYIYIPGLKLQTLTWACWFKCVGEGSGTSQRILSEGRDIGSVGTNIWVNKDGTVLSFTTHKIGASWNISLNTWYHVALVCGNGKAQLYINGDLVRTVTYTEDSDYAQSNDAFVIGKMAHLYTSSSVYFPFNGLINDVRIYDHALSPREVKEISKGLVCHYTLSGIGGENLLRNTSFKDGSNNWSLNGGVSLAYNDEYNGQPSVTLTPLTSATNRVNISQNCTNQFSNINSLPQVTVSFWYKAESGANNYGVGAILRIANTNSLYNDIISPTGLKVDGEWHRYEKTVDLSVYNNTGVTAIAFMVFCYSKSVSYSMIKLEKGSVATPWTPNPADDLYTAMGLDDGIEYDVSGYGHNGTKTGTITYDVDTPRYWTSSYFDGGDNAISVPFNTVIPDSTTPFTINLWFKKTELGTDSYETLFGGPSGFEMDTRSGNSTTLSLYMASTRGGNVYSPFNLNEWYMVSLASDRTNEYYYVNGELVKTIEAKTMPIGNYFIGAWQAASRQNIKGYISDFRIYATALSAEDILALYNNPVSLTSNGALLTQGEVTE